MVTKYQREEIAKHDKTQYCFKTNYSGEIEPNQKSYAETQQDFNVSRILVCPFCLVQNRLSKFLVYNTKGKKFKKFNRFMGKCPECKNQIQFKTLFACINWNGKEFADFVFPYSKMGFWKKIYPSFEIWNNRLRETGESLEFWLRYHELKGDSQDYEYQHDPRKFQNED